MGISARADVECKPGSCVHAVYCVDAPACRRSARRVHDDCAMPCTSFGRKQTEAAPHKVYTKCTQSLHKVGAVPGGAGFCRRLRASQKLPDFVPDQICLFLRELLPVIFRPHLKNRTLAMRLSVRRAGLHRLHRPKDLLKLVLQHLGNLLPAQKVLLCHVGA